MNMYTVVWGDQHLDWFQRACVKSLSWPENAKALNGAEWHIFTKESDIKKVEKILDDSALVVKRHIHCIHDHVVGNSPQMGTALLECLLWMITECLKTNSKLLMIPPDTIFAEGTIPNLLRLGVNGECVAVAHPRASPSIFGSMKDRPMSSAELVSASMKHAHKAWTYTEIGHPNNSSFIGGISWQKLGPQLWAVQHRLPTVYLATFKPSDLSFFKSPHEGLPPAFWYWDHAWPSELIKQERQRIVGSSDAAFIVEVTKEDLNIPPAHPANPFEPDAYWKREHHNSISRGFVTVFRGEN